MNMITNMDPDEVRSFMAGKRPDEYFILDVRQPWEYEEIHLPGARLIPLPEVPENLSKLPHDKPVIVYCLSGGRSSAAARILAGEGLSVINLVGGAAAWQGEAAYGPVDMGLVAIPKDADPEHVLIAACGMEMRLQDFYLKREKEAENPEEGNLFHQLAEYEDRHRRTLYALYEKILQSPMSRHEFEERARQAGTGLSEGGVEPEVFIEEYGEIFDGLHGIVQLGMFFEAQALDYYMRCARMAENQDAAEALTHLAREENAHLKLLGRFMDGLGS